MLGYAVETRSARRKASPSALALIAAGHAALILAVLNSKMDLPARLPEPPIVIEAIDPLQEPPPIPPEPRQPETPLPREVPIDRVPSVVPIPDLRPSEPYVPQPLPRVPDLGTETISTPAIPTPAVRVDPKPITPEHALRPPYPEAMRRLDEEAVLRLRLSIDERGRVRSVEPIGPANPLFLASARNHLIRNWRYVPATEGGRPIASSIVITLRFELDRA